VYFLKIKDYYLPFEVSFKAGTFNLDVKDFDSLIEALNDYDNTTSSVASEGLVTFPEGSTIRDMSLILEEQGIVNAQAFLELTNDKEYYEELRKKYNWLPEYKEGKINLLEGYLHPNSYAFEPNTLPHKIIETLLSETNKWYEENKVAILSSNYTFDELVTLASVVEKESKFSEDRPKVAQVFFNRLRLGMKLESDITAAYANQEHKVFMTYDDIATDSPYNTYKTSGIPIGPINAPSIESLNATLKPSGEQFTAIYFYARPDGTTFYANTFEEHEQNRLKYEHEWLELSKQEQQNKNN